MDIFSRMDWNAGFSAVWMDKPSMTAALANLGESLFF
ncbi:MAG: hypothetical protein UX17_C0036G0003 [Parcubacteria group bacterium GW2011_GWC2_45_7]|nr:MAG: hypothetical protein UX17_C0036G0003 [Parcubacteria group bacterium GW2011_GWC2_45_7]